MPDFNPTIGGRLLQSKTNFNTAALEDAMPDQDSTAAVAVDDGHQDRTIETLFGYVALPTTSYGVTIASNVKFLYSSSQIP